MSHRTRTDRAGYFRIVHAPFARLHRRLLICAEGNAFRVDTLAQSALVWTGYGLSRYTGRFPEAPSDKGWIAPVPSSCPVKRIPLDGREHG